MRFISDKNFEYMMKDWRSLLSQYQTMSIKQNRFEFQLEKQRKKTIKLHDKVQQLRQELRNKK